MTWDLQTEIEPPADSRPLTADQLLPEQVQTLRAAQQALWNIVQQNRRALGAPDIQGRAPFARPDADRSPRVLLIDGGRGTGKSSLMLTLLDRLSAHRPTASRSAKERMKRDNDAFKLDDGTFKHGEDSAKRAADRERAVYHPHVAAHVLCMPPLDFDPMPPCVPIVAWLLESLRGLVELVHADQRECCISLDSLSRAERQRGDLRRDWSELIDAAVAAWENGPDSGQTFAERNEADRRRLATLTGFNAKLNSVLNKLFDALEKSKDACVGKGGVVLIAIDDADMQVRRSPELLHALRLVYHPRVVFMLTANWYLMEEALDAYYLGQLLRLASTSDLALNDAWTKKVGLATNLNPRRDIAEQLLAKTIPSVHRFRQPELGVREILSLLGQVYRISTALRALILAKTSEHADQWKTSYRLCLQEIQVLSTTLAKPTEGDHDTSLGGGAWGAALLITKLAAFAPKQLDLRHPPDPAALLRSILARSGGGLRLDPVITPVVQTKHAVLHAATTTQIVEVSTGRVVPKAEQDWATLVGELVGRGIFDGLIEGAIQEHDASKVPGGPTVTVHIVGAQIPWPQLPPRADNSGWGRHLFKVGPPDEDATTTELRLLQFWMQHATGLSGPPAAQLEGVIRDIIARSISDLPSSELPKLVALVHPVFGLNLETRKHILNTARRVGSYDQAIVEAREFPRKVAVTLSPNAQAWLFSNGDGPKLHEPWLSVHLGAAHGIGGWAAARFQPTGEGFGTAIKSGDAIIDNTNRGINLAYYFTNGPFRRDFLEQLTGWAMPEVAAAIDELGNTLGDAEKATYWSTLYDQAEMPDSRRFEIFFDHLMRYAWTANTPAPSVRASTDRIRIRYDGAQWGIELTWAAEDAADGQRHRWRVRDAGGAYLKFAHQTHERVAAAMLGIAADISSGEVRPMVLPVRLEPNADGCLPLGCPDFKTYADLERCRCAATRFKLLPVPDGPDQISSTHLIAAMQWVTLMRLVANSDQYTYFGGHPALEENIDTLIFRTNEAWSTNRLEDQRAGVFNYWMLEVQRRYGAALDAPAAREWAKRFENPVGATNAKDFPPGHRGALQVARAQALQQIRHKRPIEASDTLAKSIQAAWTSLPVYDAVLLEAIQDLADLYSLLAFDAEAASCYALLLDVHILRESALAGSIQRSHTVKPISFTLGITHLANDAPEIVVILAALRRAGTHLDTELRTAGAGAENERKSIIQNFFNCLAAVLRARPLLGLEWAEFDVIKRQIGGRESEARRNAPEAYSTFVAAHVNALIDTGSTVEKQFAHNLGGASTDESLRPSMEAEVRAGEALEAIALSRLQSQRGSQAEANQVITRAFARYGIGEGENPLPVPTPATNSPSDAGELRRAINSLRRWLAACGLQYARTAEHSVRLPDSGNGLAHLRSLRQIVAGAGIPAHPLVVAISLSAITRLTAQVDWAPGTNLDVDYQEWYDDESLTSRRLRGERHPASMLAMELWIHVLELNHERDKGSQCNELLLEHAFNHLGLTNEHTLRAAQTSFAPYLNQTDEANTDNTNIIRTLSDLVSDILTRRVHTLRARATQILNAAATVAVQGPLFRNAQAVVDWWLTSRDIVTSGRPTAEPTEPTEHGMEDPPIAPETLSAGDTMLTVDAKTTPPTENHRPKRKSQARKPAKPSGSAT